jgi:carboxyl-terminal processing protease
MKKRIIGSVAVLCLLMSVWAFTAPQNDKYFEILKNLDIFATMYKEVNANYVDDVNPNLIMETGIDAMLRSLDPYTVYYAEDEIEDVRTENTGQYGGIGALIGQRLDGGVYILMPDEGFAADQAGLRRGDEIVAINGQDVKGDYEKASQFLRGQSDEEVVLTVIKGANQSISDKFTTGEEPNAQVQVKLKFEQITLPNVPYSGLVNETTGLVKLTGFRPNASKEVRQAIRQLKKEGADKVILDLRGNGGGLLNEAVNISNLFIEKGELVVTTKGKLEEMNASYKTLNAVYDEDIPVAVLINSASASASEIVAGVMQDYDRGVVIGQRSFGKGLVQRTMPLSYNSQLKVTIAKYYTPSGRCIQALDYSNRNADGSVGKVADSLKTLFTTANGRPVYDGGGVDPDFAIEAKRFSPIVIGLLAQDAFFEFANTYDFGFSSVNSPQEIEITDQHYIDFVNWLSNKTIDYASPLEKELTTFRLLAEEQGELEKISGQLDALEQQIQNDQAADLAAAKSQIVFLLQEEAAGRMFLEKGQLEASFKTDEDVLKAIEILSDPQLLKATLSGQ